MKPSQNHWYPSYHALLTFFGQIIIWKQHKVKICASEFKKWRTGALISFKSMRDDLKVHLVLKMSPQPFRKTSRSVPLDVLMLSCVQETLLSHRDLKLSRSGSLQLWEQTLKHCTLNQYVRFKLKKRRPQFAGDCAKVCSSGSIWS